MNALVYNSIQNGFNLGWESNALRTGLLLFEGTVCIGPSFQFIRFEELAKKMLPKQKVEFMINNCRDEGSRKQYEEWMRILKSTRKIKHWDKRGIVIKKQMENALDDLFQLHVDDTMEYLKQYGLTQLAPLCNEEDGLYTWPVEDGQGERIRNHQLSSLLDVEFTDHPEATPDVFVLYERLGKKVQEERQLTPMAVLPNLNELNANQLKSVCMNLEPVRQRLGTLLPLMPPDEEGYFYCTGQWNTEALKALSTELQAALDADPELERIGNLNREFRTFLHVGTMDTVELWELFHAEGILPDDTWRALQRIRTTGEYCPYIPIMTITTDWGQNQAPHYTEEETLNHRRKTIDLD